MKLLLTSSGNTNKSIEKALLGLLGKPFKKASLTFIPTAANIVKGDKGWLVDDMNNFKKLGFSLFEIVDIAVVPKEIWLPKFEKADILVFGGGSNKYLLDWMNKTGVKEYLSKALVNKIYVGISAGSMVTARNISLSYDGILYYENKGTLQNVPGLGYVDFEIRPHLNSKWFPKVRVEYLEKLAKLMKNQFYAIDDNTAIKAVDGNVTIVSEGEWKKFH